MLELVWRIVYAAAIAFLVWIVCVFLGGLAGMVTFPILAYVLNFIGEQAMTLAVIAFLFALASGQTFTLPRLTRG